MAGEDIADFTRSSTYTRPWDDFEDSWSLNQNAQDSFGVSDLVFALFEDGAIQNESFEYSWREPQTGGAFNHQSSFLFDESNFTWALFDGIAVETAEDFENDWGSSPYNQEAIDSKDDGTFSVASFDTTPENYEDFEEDWGISPYNQQAEYGTSFYVYYTTTAASFGSPPEAYEDFDEWTETFTL